MTDQIVLARHILTAQLQLKREGATPLMQRLKSTEPELANYLFESLSLLHSQLSRFHAPAKRTQRFYRQVEELLLIVIASQALARQELWKDAPDSPASESS